MASKSTNDAVMRLRERQAAEQRELRRRHAVQVRAVAALAAAQAAVQAAEAERAAVLARVDAAVAAAVDGRDAVVAVLVRLTSAQDTALLVGPSVAEVRRAAQRAPGELVDRLAERLSADGKRGRRGGADMSARPVSGVATGRALAGAGLAGDPSGGTERGGGEGG